MWGMSLGMSSGSLWTAVFQCTWMIRPLTCSRAPTTRMSAGPMASLQQERSGSQLVELNAKVCLVGLGLSHNMAIQQHLWPIASCYIVKLVYGSGIYLMTPCSLSHLTAHGHTNRNACGSLAEQLHQDAALDTDLWVWAPFLFGWVLPPKISKIHPKCIPLKFNKETCSGWVFSSLCPPCAYDCCTFCCMWLSHDWEHPSMRWTSQLAQVFFQ